MNVEAPEPGTWSIDPERSSVSFVTRHMFGLAGVTGTFALDSGEIIVTRPVGESIVRAAAAAASFSTGSSARDKKVRATGFLDAAGHPLISFESQTLRTVGDAWVLQGTLRARGVAAPLELTVTSAEVRGTDLDLKASGSVDRYAHGITAMKGMAGRHLRIEVDAHATLAETA